MRAKVKEASGGQPPLPGQASQQNHSELNQIHQHNPEWPGSDPR